MRERSRSPHWLYARLFRSARAVSSSALGRSVCSMVRTTNLWRTDGTVAGTFLVKDIRPIAGIAMVSCVANVGGTGFFWGDDSKPTTLCGVPTVPPGNADRASLLLGEYYSFAERPVAAGSTAFMSLANRLRRGVYGRATVASPAPSRSTTNRPRNTPDPRYLSPPRRGRSEHVLLLRSRQL
jgi:hypothetical protein